MISVDDFEESAKWNCDRGFGYKDIHMTCHEAYVIITRLREAEKDAARYRWLRDNNNSYCADVLASSLSCCEWDDEIDQAMKEKGDE
jgi:hypothetical protein